MAKDGNNECNLTILGWDLIGGLRTMVGSENDCRIENDMGYGRSDGIEDECGY